jgi:hypothetical protein
MPLSGSSFHVAEASQNHLPVNTHPAACAAKNKRLHPAVRRKTSVLES